MLSRKKLKKNGKSLLKQIFCNLFIIFEKTFYFLMGQNYKRYHVLWVKSLRIFQKYSQALKIIKKDFYIYEKLSVFCFTNTLQLLKLLQIPF